MKTTLLATIGKAGLVLIGSFMLTFLSYAQEEPCDPESIYAELQVLEEELLQLNAEAEELSALAVQLEYENSANEAERTRKKAEIKRLQSQLKARNNNLGVQKKILSYHKGQYDFYGCPDSENELCAGIAERISEYEAIIAENLLLIEEDEALLESALAKLEQLAQEAENIALAQQQNLQDRTINKARRAKTAALSKKLTLVLAKCCQNNWDKDNDGFGSIACGGEDCDDNDDTVYPGATEICNDGKDNDCDGLVDETDLTADAGTCVSAYYGYAPMDGATLSVTASGGSGTYSYTWSTGGNTGSITVTPSETTEYSVTVTDSYGCTAVATVTVQVIDVRCGNNGDKVMVCHSAGKSGKTEQLCIASSAVKAHLKHGDQLGSCNQDDPCGNSGAISLDPDLADMVSELEESFHIYPNPAQTEIYVSGHSGASLTISILDVQGKLVWNVEGQTESQKVDVSGLPNGMYFFRIQSGSHQQIERLVIMH